MTVHARLNHGRWISDCPRTGCRGAEIVEPGRPFVCGSCYPGVFSPDPLEAQRWGRIAAVQGDAHAVEFPPERGAIDAAVAGRLIDFRNWEPGETVEQLIAENVAHGVVAGEGS